MMLVVGDFGGWICCHLPAEVEMSFATFLLTFVRGIYQEIDRI